LIKARIDCESFAADKPLLDAAAQDALEHATEEIALPEAAMPVLGESRVIRHRSIQTEPAEPPVGLVIGEVLAREGPVCASRLVEDCNVWLDPVERWLTTVPPCFTSPASAIAIDAH
jgi:hypothetical protein